MMKITFIKKENMFCYLPLELYSIIFDSLTINDIINIYYVNKFLLSVLSDEYVLDELSQQYDLNSLSFQQYMKSLNKDYIIKIIKIESFAFFIKRYKQRSLNVLNIIAKHYTGVYGFNSKICMQYGKDIAIERFVSGKDVYYTDNNLEYYIDNLQMLKDMNKDVFYCDEYLFPRDMLPLALIVLPYKNITLLSDRLVQGYPDIFWYNNNYVNCNDKELSLKTNIYICVEKPFQRVSVHATKEHPNLTIYDVLFATRGLMWDSYEKIGPYTIIENNSKLVLKYHPLKNEV